jgi:hypothetical protein
MVKKYLSVLNFQFYKVINDNSFFLLFLYSDRHNLDRYNHVRNNRDSENIGRNNLHRYNRDHFIRFSK